MQPFRVPVGMHRDNRARLVALFALDNASAAEGAGCVLLFRGGEQGTRYETDHEPLFRQESFFAHLFGVTEAGCYATIHVPSGKSTLFVPRLPEAYAVWMGTIQPASFFADKYGVDAALYVDELAAFLTADPAVVASTVAAPALHTLHGLNSDTGESGPPLPSFEGFTQLPSTATRLRAAAVEVRVLKSEAEVAVLQRVNDIASDAHLAVMRLAKPGMAEFQLESLFLHHCYYHGGCRMAAYTGICGCGPSGAVLHYGHAGAPNDRECGDGEMMLLDMGVEHRCYCCDITCSFPVASSGKFTDDQRFVFETVRVCTRAGGGDLGGWAVNP